MTGNKPEAIQAKDLKIFFDPKDRLRAATEDRCWHTVKPVWAAPLSHPKTFLALLDAKDQEIATIPNPDDLDAASREAVETELVRRYLTATVQRILDVKSDWGSTYWTVETNRGRRELVTQSLQETVQWLGENHLLLTDVDGNKFEIENILTLDEASQAMIRRIL